MFTVCKVIALTTAPRRSSIEVKWEVIIFGFVGSVAQSDKVLACNCEFDAYMDSALL